MKFGTSAKPERAQTSFTENVVVRRLAPDGSVETRIDARSCVVDRFTKSGWAEGAARVQHGKTSLAGKDVYFSSPESYVRIFEGADLQSEGVKVKEVRL